MARTFTGRDAQRIADEHKALLERLSAGAGCFEKYKDSIKRTADALIAEEVLNILKEIPIDELGRDRSGLRIKNLKDSGYLTIADIASEGTYALASVQGISEDGARTIKRIAQDYADRARQDVKLKISADSRTQRNTELISAIYRYRSSKALSAEASDLYESYSRKIGYDIEDLEPSKKSLKWFFSSSQVKKKAEDAYAELTSLINGDYGKRAEEVCRGLRKLDHLEDGEAWEDFRKDPIPYFTALEDVCPGILGSADEVYGLPEELAREIQGETFEQEGLLCKLRRYQEWGVKYILHQGRVLLGDEMGLGKTVQAIAAMVSLKNTGATHFVVVCPASVLTNWCREIRKHSRLSVIKVHGNDKEEAFKSWLKLGDVAVTTYETTSHFAPDPDFKIDMLVVDEAHYIKNPAAARTKNVKALCDHAERILFMTGTALENRVDEMIGLIGILQPDVASGVKNIAFMSGAQQFRDRISPVYYRRKREQVLTELPELIENKEWCTMTKEEEEVYEKTLLSGNLMAVRRVSWNVPDLKYSSKANRLKEIVEDAKEDDRKIIVFSFFLDTLRAVAEVLGPVCTEQINGSVPPARRQEIIDEFDKAPAGAVLPAQIQSGGTGLNIQSASVVVICEPQYKPSTENQAISRAYRMGQARNVLVYRLLSDETVDERMLEIIERKQTEFDAFADESTAARVEEADIDDKILGDIIGAEVERIKAAKMKAAQAKSSEMPGPEPEIN